MSSSRNRQPLSALLLAAGLFTAQAATAQVSTGALSGKFAPTDKITLRNVGTNLRRDVKVKDDGTFWVRRLPVGTYEVTVVHADGSEQKFLAAARLGITTPVN